VYLLKVYHKLSLASGEFLGLVELQPARPPFSATIKARVKEDVSTVQGGVNTFYPFELVRDTDVNRLRMAKIKEIESQVERLRHEANRLRNQLETWDLDELEANQPTPQGDARR